MSIIAVGELCGRCAARKHEPPIDFPAEVQDTVEALRGEVLVAADRRRYPRLRAFGRIVAGGTEEWLPLLREADQAQLRELLLALERHHLPTRKEVDDEHPALID